MHSYMYQILHKLDGLCTMYNAQLHVSDVHQLDGLYTMYSYMYQMFINLVHCVQCTATCIRCSSTWCIVYNAQLHVSEVYQLDWCIVYNVQLHVSDVHQLDALCTLYSYIIICSINIVYNAQLHVSDVHQLDWCIVYNVQLHYLMFINLMHCVHYTATCIRCSSTWCIVYNAQLHYQMFINICMFPLILLVCCFSCTLCLIFN